MVWVRVMQLLDVADRSRLARTCTRLHALLEHPSVWGCLIVNFWRPGFGTPPYGYGVHVTSHDEVARKLLTVMRKFGEFIQHARLRWLDKSLTSAAFDFLADGLASSRCLKSVTLELVDVNLKGLFPDAEDFGDSRVSEFMRDFSVVRSPPVRINIEAYISDSIHVNRALFWALFACSCQDIRCRSWTALHLDTSYSDEKLSVELQVPAPIALLVSRLPSLQHLHAGAHCLSDQLLYELSQTSKRSPLKTLNIVYHESGRHNDPLPALSAEAWAALAFACPATQVNCPSLYFRFSNSLHCVLKPETPLVSVKVEDSRPEPSLVASCFSTDQSRTLTTLHYEVVAGQHYLYGGQPIPGAVPRPGMVGNMSLFDLVTACPRLQHLVYKNTIHHSDIVRVAQLARQWRTFHFNEDLILTDEDDNADDTRDNQPDSEGGETGIGVRSREEAAARRMNALHNLCQAVSRAVGYTWQPTPRLEREEEPLDSFLYLRFF